MKKEKILYLEKMGNDFPIGEPIKDLSDLGNYRLRFKNIKLNKKYINTLRENAIPIIEGDIISGRNYREDTLDIKSTKLFLDTQYNTIDGGTYRPLTIESIIHNKNYEYTKKDVLKAINEISKDTYTKIIIVERGM